MIHEQITRLFHAFRRDSHPMAVMCGITGALAAFYHDSLDVAADHNPRHREIAAFRLLSKMPTMAAMCYKYSIGQPFVYPRNDLSYAGNFLNMMFSTPCEPYEVNPIPGTCYGPYSDPCTLTMNRTPPPPPCVPLALRVRTRLPVSQQVLLHCGDLRTVVLTKRR